MFPWKASSRSITLFLATASLTGLAGLLVSSAPAQEAAAITIPGGLQRSAPRIVSRIDENHLAVLKGNVHPEARAEFDRGRVQPETVMGDLYLGLRRAPAEQAAFEAFLDSQDDPRSPNYHHWLTPDEIGERFGPDQADIDVLTDWLQNHGFTVKEVSKDRLSIRFDGLAGKVESAFHTEIHNLQVRGDAHIANMSEPQIPEALTPVVVGVKALHNFFPHPLHKAGGVVRRNSDGTWERISGAPVNAARSVAPKANAKTIGPLFGTAGTPAQVEDVAPYDFATIYNVLPLWNASTPINGSGQVIAIAGTSNINQSDVTTFKSAFGLPAGHAPIFYTGNTDPGDCPTFARSCQGDLVENTLDVEWSGAVAPQAQIILVGSSATTPSTDNLWISENYIVNDPDNKIHAKIMNVSYGECEFFMGTTQNTMYSNLWSTAKAAGIAVFVATGDAGSATCDQGQDQGVTPYGAEIGLSVSGIASTPYNVAVGGTDFTWSWITNAQNQYWNTSNNGTNKSNAKGYMPESPWNATCANLDLVAFFNTQLGPGLTPGSVCDDVGTEQITSTGGSLLYLVDMSGGGGGKSSCINGNGLSLNTCTLANPKPAFQAGVTGLPSDGVRDIPDVSFFASNGFGGSAYVICVSAAGTCSFTQGTEPVGLEYGGTSISSPAMAGVMALINQKAGTPQGNPNAQLYKLAGQETYSGCSSESVPLSGSSCIFYDIDAGTNAQPCAAGSANCTSFSGEEEFSVLSGYSATVGYDYATGLGSMNVANLVNAFAAASAPAVTLTPPSLTFTGTNVGASAATQDITLKNSGSASLTISGITITGTNSSSFTQTNTCGATLAASATCAITVTFTPAASGALSASVSIADNATGSPQTAALTGTGVAVGPVVSFNSTSLTFASTNVGTADPTTQAVTLTNTGNASLTITGIAITGTNASSFTQTNTCGATLAASASCAITVTFNPTAGGTLTAAVSVTDSATGSPHTVTLTGTGTVPAPIVTLSPTSLNFVSSFVGTPDPTQAITLKNTGTAALTGIAISITGANTSSFSQTNACPASLAVNATCSITVTFTPQVGGALTANVSIADNATGSPQTVVLTGAGLVPMPAASFSVSSLSFPSTTVGQSSTAMPVVLTNTGSASLLLTSVTIGGANSSSFTQTNNCPADLGVTANCTVNVTFTPATFSTTAQSATLVFTDNVSGSTQSIGLSGIGTEVGTYTLSAAAVSVAPGSSGSSAITATGASGYSTPNTVTLKTCVLATKPTGAVDLPTCTITGASVTFASGATTGSGGTVSIGTTAASTTNAVKAQLADPNRTGKLAAGLGGAALAGLLFFGIPARRRIWRSMLGLVFFAAMMTALSGCGGGGGGGGGGTPNPGTTAGTYTFTVTGTDSDGVQQTATVTATVS